MRPGIDGERGEPFGSYRLDRELLPGALGRRFAARLAGPGGDKGVTLELVRPALTRDPRFRRRLADDAAHVVGLAHPGLVTVYELGAVEGTIFVATEPFEGATLAAMLEGDGPLAVPLVAHLVAELAATLHHVHRRTRVGHRNVTPAQVLVSPEGRVLLGGFGLAVAHGVDRRVAGDPRYAAPEQLLGADARPAVDFFALGAVAHHALSGAPPFAEDGPRVAAPSFDDLPDVPHSLAHLLDPMLALDPQERPASGDAVARRLRSWLASAGPPAVEEALGARAAAALERAVLPPPAPLLLDPPGASAEPPGPTRSLARSAVLEAFLAGSLPPEALSGPMSPPPSAPPTTLPPVPGPAPVPTEAEKLVARLEAEAAADGPAEPRAGRLRAMLRALGLGGGAPDEPG